MKTIFLIFLLNFSSNSARYSSDVSHEMNEMPSIVGLVTDVNHVALDGVAISHAGEAVKTKADGKFIWEFKRRYQGILRG